MALKACSECGHNISEKALHCPKCGTKEPFKNKAVDVEINDNKRSFRGLFSALEGPLAFCLSFLIMYSFSLDKKDLSFFSVPILIIFYILFKITLKSLSAILNFVIKNETKPRNIEYVYILLCLIAIFLISIPIYSYPVLSDREIVERIKGSYIKYDDDHQLFSDQFSVNKIMKIERHSLTSLSFFDCDSADFYGYYTVSFEFLYKCDLQKTKENNCTDQKGIATAYIQVRGEHCNKILLPTTFDEILRKGERRK